MRLAFNDIKKTISRRGGEPRLIPYLLPLHGVSGRASTGHPSSIGASGGRPARELDALIALYESYTGRPRLAWPEDRAATLIGDYRLARCLENVLSEWYVWQSPAWPQSGNDAIALTEHDILNPSQLRLALYDFVSASHGGFLTASERDAALDTFAVTLAIPRPTLDDLLYLDSDARAVLARLTPEPPTPIQLATRYNQRVLEAVLANAAYVEWLLTPEFATATGEPLGALVKRICFLARRMGVQYEVAYADPYPAGVPLPRVAERRAPYLAENAAESATAVAMDSHIPAESATAASAGPGLAAGIQPANLRSFAPSPTVTNPNPVLNPPPSPSMSSALSVVNSSSPLVVTLYGPQEMTGAPNQYGERLARLCRALLGYRRAPEKGGRSVLAGPGLSGTARIYLHGRPFTFELDAKLLRLIGSSEASDEQDGADQSSASPQFDSSLEQRLHTQFTALERTGEAHGWRLEREPEPILVDPTILVPDFALTRGPQRVYLEVAGYWRPEYRERKARKLAAVRGHVALVLAAPEAARAEFAAFERDFPILWYKDTVSAEALLALLDRSYNDLDARLAHLDLAAIVAEVSARGCIPSVESMALLCCYSRAELARALELLQRHARDTNAPAPDWLDGLGLCSPAWLASLLDGVHHVVSAADEQRMPLAALVVALSRLLPGHLAGSVTESAAEALIRRAGLQVMRTSIFDAMVYAGEASIPAPSPAATSPKPPRTQPRRGSRRTHTRATSYTTQSIFPPEQPGPDNPEPDIPTRAP